MQQVYVNDSYAIDDPVLYICKRMYGMLRRYIDSNYIEQDLMPAFRKSGTYSFDSDKEFIVTIRSDIRSGIYYADVQGSFHIRQVFEVSYLYESDVAYIVCEHIYPKSGSDIIRRVYHEYFTDVDEAHMYRDDIAREHSENTYRLFVMSKDELDNSEWYKDNLEVYNNLVKYKPTDIDDLRYLSDIKKVNEAILAYCYEDLPFSQQYEMDRQIYYSLRKFLPEDTLAFYDEDMAMGLKRIAMVYELCESQNIDPAQASFERIEPIVNNAIKMSVINTSYYLQDRALFDEIKKVLGFHYYRVDALTADIYLANPNHGRIVMSSDGEIRWYDTDGWVLNQWQGSVELGFHGKFQKNLNYILPSLGSFRPDLIAESQPTRQQFDEYDRKYFEYKQQEAARHDEMVYDIAYNGLKLAKGTWYRSGIALPSNKADNVMFEINYPAKADAPPQIVFTPEQCKALLSGEEICLEGYKPKGIDKIISVKGRLSEARNPKTGALYVKFFRTDIGNSSRMKVNRVLGIEEPGVVEKLPSKDDSNGKIISKVKLDKD